METDLVSLEAAVEAAVGELDLKQVTVRRDVRLLFGQERLSSDRHASGMRRVKGGAEWAGRGCKGRCWGWEADRHGGRREAERSRMTSKDW